MPAGEGTGGGKEGGNNVGCVFAAGDRERRYLSTDTIAQWGKLPIGDHIIFFLSSYSCVYMSIILGFRPVPLPADAGARRRLLPDAQHPARRLQPVLQRHHQDPTQAARKVLLHKT